MQNVFHLTVATNQSHMPFQVVQPALAVGHLTHKNAIPVLQCSIVILELVQQLQDLSHLVLQVQQEVDGKICSNSIA